MTKSERTRKNIIEKSATLFNQKGYSGTSLQDIMDAASISKGGLYGHFKGGKEEIAVAAFDYAVECVYSKVGKRTHVIKNTVDKLKSVLYFYRENIFTPPVEGGCPIQNTSVEADDNQPVLKRQVIKAIQDWHARVVHTLRKGKERQEIREDVKEEDFATRFIGVIEGGIMLARILEDEAHFDVMTRPLLEELDAIRLLNPSVKN